MNALDKVIGYEGIKKELRQLLDMMKNRERYEALGAKMPRGLLISGKPGLGKSLMARCFMEDLGWNSYTIRRNRPDGDFVRELNRVFKEVAENTPSVILLDDMDKFVVEDKGREEYVAVQAGIDEIAGKDVYIIATANDLRDIPGSLLRAGRFDSKIEVDEPDRADAEAIVAFYLGSKSLGDSVCPSDVAKMLRGKSCAALESVLNQAAIYAGYERSEKIEMRHIVEAILCNEYSVCSAKEHGDERRNRYVAYHEAGHAVMQDILREGGVGLVSIRPSSRRFGGFMRRCANWDMDDFARGPLLVALAGAAATELKFGVRHMGTSNDFSFAMSQVREKLEDEGMYGLGLLEAPRKSSNDLMAWQEQATGVELEREMTAARKILAENREYLDAVAAELMEKRTLLNSDMKRIRAGCKIVRYSLSDSMDVA